MSIMCNMIGLRATCLVGAVINAAGCILCGYAPNLTVTAIGIGLLSGIQNLTFIAIGIGLNSGTRALLVLSLALTWSRY